MDPQLNLITFWCSQWIIPERRSFYAPRWQAGALVVFSHSGHLSLSQFTSLDFSMYSSNTPAKFVMHPDHRGGSQVGAAAVWRRQLLAKWEVWWIMKVLEMSLAIQEDIVLMAPITLLASLKFVGMSSVKILRQLALSSSKKAQITTLTNTVKIICVRKH